MTPPLLPSLEEVRAPMAFVGERAEQFLRVVIAVRARGVRARGRALSQDGGESAPQDRPDTVFEHTLDPAVIRQYGGHLLPCVVGIQRRDIRTDDDLAGNQARECQFPVAALLVK